MRLLLTLCIALSVARPAMAADVIATIKPLHSLVASVMAGSDMEPELLTTGKGSLHDYALKPSQVMSVRSAKLVFAMGPGFEHFMTPLLPQLPGKILLMQNVKGLTLYPVRSGGDFEPHGHVHDHDHDHEEHEEEGAVDLHLWLSPSNAQIMVIAIAQALAEIYPDKADLFLSNAKALTIQFKAMDTSLAKRMQKLKAKPYITFHDAYQYFEKHYGLTSAGSITLHPEQGLRAGHVQALRARIARDKVACVFREPEFDAAVVEKLIAGTGARTAPLDPEGASLPPGPALYPQLMEAIASGMESCIE